LNHPKAMIQVLGILQSSISSATLLPFSALSHIQQFSVLCSVYFTAVAPFVASFLHKFDKFFCKFYSSFISFPFPLFFNLWRFGWRVYWGIYDVFPVAR